MTTQTKTATKATKTKTRIPNLDSDSPTFCLYDGGEMILGGATYWNCWQLWVVRGGMKDDRLFICHESEIGSPDNALPIPNHPDPGESLNWDDLADDWDMVVNDALDNPHLYEEEPAPIFTRREEFYLCQGRGVLFGPANYIMCRDVALGVHHATDGLKIVHKNRMSQALPFPKTRKGLEKLFDTWGKKQVATK